MWILLTLVLLALGLAVLELHARAAGVVLRLHGAHPLHCEQAPRVHALVARLSSAARMAMPRLYVLHRPEPNAFSLGTRRRDAGIVLTDGALRELDDAALAALVAHELAHILQGHTRKATLATAMAAVLMRAPGGKRRVGPVPARNAVAFRKALEWLHGPETLLMRELRADRFAARLTGSTQGLIALLDRLKAQRGAEGATADAGPGGPFTAFCSWRPEGAVIDARIRALRFKSGIRLQAPRRGSRFLNRSRQLFQDGLHGRREGSAG